MWIDPGREHPHRWSRPEPDDDEAAGLSDDEINDMLSSGATKVPDSD